jgi:hypothetical protein
MLNHTFQICKYIIIRKLGNCKLLIVQQQLYVYIFVCMFHMRHLPFVIVLPFIMALKRMYHVTEPQDNELHFFSLPLA